MISNTREEVINLESIKSDSKVTHIADISTGKATNREFAKAMILISIVSFFIILICFALSIIPVLIFMMMVMSSAS